MYGVHLSLSELYRQCCADLNQHNILCNSGKDRCARYMWSNDMFAFWNCNETSSNVMWTIRNEADKTFVRTK